MRGRSPLTLESTAPTVWLMHAATGRCHRVYSVMGIFSSDKAAQKVEDF